MGFFLKDPKLDDLKAAVGGGEEPGKNRPNLPREELQVPKNLIQFITTCWASNGDKRPTFASMFPDTPWEKAAETRSANSEVTYKKLIESFKDKQHISFADFLKKFIKIFELEGQLNINNPSHHYIRALQAVLSVENIGEHPVTRQVVERFIQWFGGESTILPCVYDICCRRWFFGELSQKAAEEILQRSVNKAPGTFLVRWDKDQNGWRLNWIEEENKKSVIKDEPVPELAFDKQQVTKLIRIIKALTEKKDKKYSLKNPAQGRASSFSGVEIKDFISGHSSGAYLQANSPSSDPFSSDHKSKHFNFVL